MPLCPHARRLRRLLPAGAALVLAAWLGAAAPALAAEFTDAAGRRLHLPDNIRRVLPAERNAEVLVYVLAPDKLVGIEPLSSTGVKAAGKRLPLLNFGLGMTPADIAEAARDYRADLILDAGPVTPERAAFADAVQQQSGIPYIMVYDGFERLQQVLPSLGQVFGVGDRATELDLFFEYDIARLRGRQQIQPADERPHVYYGLGPDGLTTPLPGSLAGNALNEAGAINVAGKLGRGTLARISREHLLSWNPDIIIAEDWRFYSSLRRDRAWRGLSAVQKNRVYLEPNEPFGWINNPPGINRLIGLYWLSALFYTGPTGTTPDEFRGITCEFYDKFYRIRLTNRQLNDLLAPAGIPRPEPAKPIAAPLSPGPIPGAPGAVQSPPSDFGTAPGAAGTIPALPPELAPPPSRPVPVIPGTELGGPGTLSPKPSPALPDQPGTLCTIPGIAAPITTDLSGTVPGTSGLPAAPGVPAVPGGRVRQPRARGLPNGGAPDNITFPTGPGP